MAYIWLRGKPPRSTVSRPGTPDFIYSLELSIAAFYLLYGKQAIYGIGDSEVE
jgi:hypothetical protein